MKLDNDHTNFHSTPPHKSYNPFDSDDETVDYPGLKALNLLLKDDSNVFDLKPSDKYSGTISFHLDNGDFLWQEAALGHPRVDNHAFDGYTASANGGRGSLPQKESQLYTDKNVTECELPEFEVCYKESNSQSVKDIGVDNGVPSPDKCIALDTKSGEEQPTKDLSEVVALDMKGNDALIGDTGNNLHQVSELKSPKSTAIEDIGNNEDQVSELKLPKSTALPSDWQKREALKNVNGDGLDNQLVGGRYLIHEFGTDESTDITELKLELEDRASHPSWSGDSLVDESREDGMFSDMVSEKDASKQSQPDLMIKDGALNHGDVVQNKKEDEASGDKSDEITLAQEALNETDTSTEPATDSAQVETKPQESLKQEESISAQPPDETATPEESIDSNNHSKLESATITFDLANSPRGNQSSGLGKEKEEGGGGGGTQNMECSKPPGMQTMKRQVEEGTTSSSDNTGLAGVSDRRVHGETSLSQGVPPPSSITFTGPVSYSGSVSLRSESSAGSTRSFAFPVLQTEWNSSPVRMAKADPRQLKKHRGGWMQSVICCRF